MDNLLLAGLHKGSLYVAKLQSQRELDNAVEVNYSQELHDFDTVTFNYKKAGYLDEE